MQEEHLAFRIESYITASKMLIIVVNRFRYINTNFLDV